MTRARHSAACAVSVTRAERLHTHRKSCAAVTCGQGVEPGQIFCENHWYFLPDWLRTDILTTFQDAEWDAHQEAMRQGVDHIDDAHLAARDAGFCGVMAARNGAGAHNRYRWSVT